MFGLVLVDYFGCLIDFGVFCLRVAFEPLFVVLVIVGWFGWICLLCLRFAFVFFIAWVLGWWVFLTLF